MGKTYIEVRPRGGHYYAYEREPYWDPVRKQGRKRTLRFLGPCDKDGHILQAPKTRIEGVHSSFPVGPLVVFYACAEQLRVRERAQRILGASEEEAGHFLALVLNQATARVPIDHLAEWAQASPLPRLTSLEPESLTTSAFEKTLTALCHPTPAKTWEDRGLLLQHELTRAWRAQAREPPGAYYDITKQAYYGWTNPYAQGGHDANGGISTVVGFGMVVSEGHHFPYLCRALPGGQNDTLSVTETVEMLRARGYRGLRLVMDRGIISKENVEKATGAGYPLVGLVKGWDVQTVALATRWSEEELARAEHVVKTSRGSVYARALTTSLFDLPRVRVAVVVSPRRRTDEREGRDLALQELEGPITKERLKELKRELRVQDPRRRKGLGYVPGLLVKCSGRRGVRVDAEAVQRDRGLDGRFLIFSTDLSLDGPGMYRAYFHRDAIEKVFRTGKGDLCLGPLRYHRKDRLDAYATVFYTASLLWSWSERTLKRKFPDMSLSEALRLLEHVSWVRFGAGKIIREWATRLTNQQEEVLSAVGATSYLPSP